MKCKKKVGANQIDYEEIPINGRQMKMLKIQFWKVSSETTDSVAWKAKWIRQSTFLPFPSWVRYGL